MSIATSNTSAILFRGTTRNYNILIQVGNNILNWRPLFGGETFLVSDCNGKKKLGKSYPLAYSSRWTQHTYPFFPSLSFFVPEGSFLWTRKFANFSNRARKTLSFFRMERFEKILLRCIFFFIFWFIIGALSCNQSWDACKNWRSSEAHCRKEIQDAERVLFCGEHYQQAMMPTIHIYSSFAGLFEVCARYCAFKETEVFL